MNNFPKFRAIAVPQIKRNLNRYPDELSADAGYFSENNINFLHEEEKIAPYIPPDRQRHGIQVISHRSAIPENMSIADGMRRFLSTKRGRKQYALRKITVEPVNGQI